MTLLPKPDSRSAFRSITALVLMCSVLFSGCMSIRNEFPEPAAAPRMSFGPLDAAGPRPVVRHFERNGRATFWLFYLIPKNKLNGYELARREAGEGEAIQNLKIQTQFDVVDFFVSFISIVFGTRRIDVEGDIVTA